MLSIVTEDVLRQIAPGCADPASWADPLNQAMDSFDINDARRAAAFLAQLAHESNELRNLVENLNYSAASLMKTWPGRFPTLDKASQYERNPEKLANYVYAMRLGN